MGTSTSLFAAIDARLIEGEQLGDLLPRHFGKYMLRFEDAVYTFMRWLSDDYPGHCSWKFFELSNGGCYMAPDCGRLNLRVPCNGFFGEMSPDAAGITACLFALDTLAFETRNEILMNHYFQLRFFALRHSEAASIRRAIS